MDWAIVVSVFVALLLWPVVLASVCALMFLTAAAVLRGRIRGLRDGRFAHWRQMCVSGGTGDHSHRPGRAEGVLVGPNRGRR